MFESSPSFINMAIKPKSSIKRRNLLTRLFVCLFACYWRDSPPVGHGMLIHEVSRSHTTTHHSR